MRLEQIKRVFNLIKSVLPENTIFLFNEFLDEYVQLKETNNYNLGIINDLRRIKSILYKELREREQDIKALNIELSVLKESLHIYEEEKEEHKNDIKVLQDKIDQLEKELNVELLNKENLLSQLLLLKEHVVSIKNENNTLRQNYTFLRKLYKSAIREIENSVSKEMHELTINKILSEKEELSMQLEDALKKIDELQAEVDLSKEQVQHYFSKYSFVKHGRKKRVY